MTLVYRPPRAGKEIQRSPRMPRLALQDHPQLNFLSRSSWPPIWVHSRPQPKRKIIGEVGTFTGTILNGHTPTHLYVKMEFEDELYMGCLVVRDVAFALQLHNFLQKHIGLSIKEVGDLDLSHML